MEVRKTLARRWWSIGHRENPGRDHLMVTTMSTHFTFRLDIWVPEAEAAIERGRLIFKDANEDACSKK
jgi:hypothetical protein